MNIFSSILNYFKSRDNWIIFLLSLASFMLLLWTDISRGALFILFILLLFGKNKKLTILSYLNSSYKWIFWSCVAFYFLNIIGLCYTPDIKGGISELGFKIPMILVPTMFVIIPQKFFTKELQKKYILYYIIGCMFFAFYTFICGIIRVLEDPQLFPVTFFKSNLAMHIHSTYASLFFVMGIVFSYYALRYLNMKKGWKYFLVFIMFFFFGYTILLSSRGGLLALVIAIILMIFSLFKTKKGIFYGILGLLFVLVSLTFALTRIPFLEGRITETKNAIDLYQSGAPQQDPRIALWENSIPFIRDHFWIGIGTGGKNIAMEEIKVDYYPELNNPHNQFLQTFIELGLFGFLSLLSIFVIGIVWAIRNKSIILVIFLLGFFVNCLFESMLERVLGNTFFMFLFFMIAGFICNEKQETLSKSF